MEIIDGNVAQTQIDNLTRERDAYKADIKTLMTFEVPKRELLVRCRSELRSILADINAEQIPHDGDDFHKLLRDLDDVIDPTK